MFVTPMISVADFDRKQAQYSAARKAAQRASSSSSEGSSLYRTSSTTSNNSHSRWSTSSISSNDARVLTQPTGKLRKGQPRVSFHLPRPLQPFHKKALSQPQAQLPPASPRSNPPPRPPRPAEPFVFPRPSVDRRTTDEPESDSSSNLSSPVQATAPVLPPIRTDSLPWQCSDLVVRCKQDVYHVDRTIMCYHSKWFARVCAIMKTPKASKSVIDLSHDDSSAVAAMMQYCYQLDYFETASEHDSAVDEVASLRPHVDIYMLAERYGMSGLKRCALDKFEDAAITVLKVSGDEEQFLTAVKTMYDPSRRANADEMRSVAVKICADHVEGFISGDYETMAMVFESMDNLPEFRSELFEEMARRWK